MANLATKEPAVDESLVETAPISTTGVLRRAGACLLDYFVTSALFILISTLFPATLPSFVEIVVATGVYYTLCHSWLGQGQSFGKKLLSLRVYSRAPETVFLSLTSSALRFLCSLGVLIFLIEVPPEIYRRTAYSASLPILELHMLPALLLLTINAALVLLTPLQLTLHDRIVGSFVAKSKKAPSLPANTEFYLLEANKLLVPKSLLYTGILVSFTSALLMWSWGVFVPTQLSSLIEKRYVIEHYNPAIRVADIRFGDQPNSVSLDALALKEISSAEEKLMAEAIGRIVGESFNKPRSTSYLIETQKNENQKPANPTNALEKAQVQEITPTNTPAVTPNQAKTLLIRFIKRPTGSASESAPEVHTVILPST